MGMLQINPAILWPVIIGALIALVIIGAIIKVAKSGSILSLFGKKTVEMRGAEGERIVARCLGGTIEGEQYLVNDVMFRDEKGKTCQIDHVFIYRNGIWVIETKNYGGMIFGNENQRQWTQVLAYGKRKNRFYNPVAQNKTHIYQLSEKLKIKNGFHSVVVFIDRADISNVESKCVRSIETLKNIKYAQTDTDLSPEKMEKIYHAVLSLKMTSDVTLNEHVHNIHQMQNAVAHNICPRCGKQLALREGKSGRFYGCSGYPNCKFTKPFDN